MKAPYVAPFDDEEVESTNDVAAAGSNEGKEKDVKGKEDGKVENEGAEGGSEVCLLCSTK